MYFNNGGPPTTTEIYYSVKVGKIPMKNKKHTFCVTTLHNEREICGCGECTYTMKFQKNLKKFLISILKRM
jgi:ribosomal protein S27AE